MAGANGAAPGPQIVPAGLTMDPGNMLITDRPAEMICARTNQPGKPELLVATIRTETTTLTVLVPKQLALQWAAMIKAEAEQMSGPGLMSGAGLITG